MGGIVTSSRPRPTSSPVASFPTSSLVPSPYGGTTSGDDVIVLVPTSSAAGVSVRPSVAEALVDALRPIVAELVAEELERRQRRSQPTTRSRRRS